ncbi:MAG: glycosyltransferase family 2 protein [Muribaculaceae bacterium]
MTELRSRDTNLTSQPLVSILVACYNVSRFIDKGISNLLKQTYTNFELIIVDDCSTDDSSALLKVWEHKDDRISVYHHSHNRGLGGARNTGLKYANGKYIYFADIDDDVNPELLSFCTDMMETTSTDMMMFGFDVVDVANNTSDYVAPNERLIHSNSDIQNIYVNDIMLAKYGSGFVWSKFYRKSFLDSSGIKFGTQKIQQDEVFNLKILAALNSLYISPKRLYRYYIYSTGNNRSRFIPDRFDITLDVRNAFENLLSKWNITDAAAISYLDRRLYVGLLTYLDYDLNHNDCKLSYREKRMAFLKATRHPKAHTAAINCMGGCANCFDKLTCLSVVKSNYHLFRISIALKKTIKTILRR